MSPRVSPFPPRLGHPRNRCTHSACRAPPGPLRPPGPCRAAHTPRRRPAARRRLTLKRTGMAECGSAGPRPTTPPLPWQSRRAGPPRPASPGACAAAAPERAGSAAAGGRFPSGGCARGPYWPGAVTACAQGAALRGRVLPTLKDFSPPCGRVRPLYRHYLGKDDAGVGGGCTEQPVSP